MPERSSEPVRDHRNAVRDAPEFALQGALRRLVEAHGSGNGLDQHGKIEPQRPMARVIEVAGDARRVAHIVAAAHLPHPRQPPSPEALARMAAVALDLHGNRRSWPHQAHVAQQDIEQLRQLVEARLAQDAAKAADPWVITEACGSRAIPRPPVDC